MKYYILLSCVLLGVSASAQEVIKATKTYWTAGMCCDAGEDYKVTIAFEDPMADKSKRRRNKVELFALREIWLKQKGLMEADEVTTTDSTATIFFSIVRTNGIDKDDIKPLEEVDNQLPEGAPEFEGEALYVIEIRGEEHSIIIGEFEAIMDIAHP